MAPKDLAPTDLAPDDLEALRRAVHALENPSLAARLTNMVGKPIELIGYALPDARVERDLGGYEQSARHGAAGGAQDNAARIRAPDRSCSTSALVTASGAAGGALGLATLPIELPVSTIIMLRSIAEIAQSEGENLSDPEAALSCVEVFALGGRTGSDDASESGYFAVRGILAKSVTEAARYVAQRGVVAEGAPVLVRFLAQVASRFGVVVSQKVAAQAFPIIGALGGAAVNYAFLEHFQDVARGHFTVRRLERVYGKELVRTEYARLAEKP